MRAEIKYSTQSFDIADDDVLWDKFMGFARAIIPYEEYWDKLSELQRYPMVVFIYDAEVIGEGHMGFLDLHSEYICFEDVIKAMEVLQVSNPYIENIENLPLKDISLEDLIDQSEDEDDFAAKMDELDEIFEVHDRAYYNLVKESTEIEDKILVYLRANFTEFFEVANEC